VDDVGEGDNEEEGVPLADAPRDSEDVGVDEDDAERLLVVDRDSLLEGV
jgi:hypothetical protein